MQASHMVIWHASKIARARGRRGTRPGAVQAAAESCASHFAGCQDGPRRSEPQVACLVLKRCGCSMHAARIALPLPLAALPAVSTNNERTISKMRKITLSF